MRDYESLFSLLLSDLGPTALDDDSWRSDASVAVVAGQALASSFYKKLCPDGNSAEADAKALIKFEAINASISAEPFEFVAESEAESCFWDYFLNEVELATANNPFGQSFDMEFIREHMDVGPGASQLANADTRMTKLFGSTLSYTDPDLIRIYRGALSEAGVWAEAEMQRFQRYGFERVEGGKLFFAPKNREISRTCCTEASLNMLVQKAIGAFLEKGLEYRFGISLATQPDLNRKLAQAGSLWWDDPRSFCTIDLTSASDCIYLSLIKRIIRNPVLRHAIMVSRCETAVLPDGRSVRLNMVSTMGNGFTFPLQTLIFASAVKAVYDVMGMPIRRDGANEFGVFGDDIIVRKPAYDFLVRMLTKLGFRTNKEKSFSTGSFRESCGCDYFAGRNVRGVYIRSLESTPEVISVINRLNRWSTYHGIALPSVIKKLMSWVPDIRVPPSEADDAGIHVPFELTKPHLTPAYWFKYRALQRKAKRVEIDEADPANPGHDDLAFACGFLSGTYRRRDFSYVQTDDGSVPSPWEGSWAVSVALRDGIGARARYQIVKKTIPYWDYLPDPKMAAQYDDGPWRVRRDPDSFSRWKATVASSVPR